MLSKLFGTGTSPKPPTLGPLMLLLWVPRTRVLGLIISAIWCGRTGPPFRPYLYDGLNSHLSEHWRRGFFKTGFSQTFVEVQKKCKVIFPHSGVFCRLFTPSPRHFGGNWSQYEHIELLTYTQLEGVLARRIVCQHNQARRIVCQHISPLLKWCNDAFSDGSDMCFVLGQLVLC